jgi:predicted nucleic acid-binding protein
VTWTQLFEQAGTWDVSVGEIRETLATRRERDRPGADPKDSEGTPSSGDTNETDPPETPNPTRIVADADVLVADLLAGGRARDALDAGRSHSWLTIPASEQLLGDTTAVIEGHASESLASAWRERARKEFTHVDHPAGDHPALASAYRSGAAHVLSFDEELTSARANAAMQAHFRVSVRTPAAFVSLFDPRALYETTHGGAYPGPDTDPHG